MQTNRFELTTAQLKAIAADFQNKITIGLSKDNTEILCIPTYITPKKDIDNAKILVLDWGGTNFRAAIVQFENGQPRIIENRQMPLSKTETKGFSKSDLSKVIADAIAQLQCLDNSVTAIGYCFSYPAEAMQDGDAKLLRWTKEIDVPELLQQLVGKSLLDYLNQHTEIKQKTIFKTIKVLNDTVACLFAGLAHKGYDTYIGLIVGTGTNMAGLVQSEKIQKLNKNLNYTEVLPVNLESGNLIPSPDTLLIDEKYLTEFDKHVDEHSNNKGQQIFEKAISGGYLGEIFKHVFPNYNHDAKFDTEKLTVVMNNSENYSQEFSAVARQIYERSAQLVAASIAGFVNLLATHDNTIKKVCVAAEGGLFWGQNEYSEIVSKEVHNLLAEFGCGDIQVTIAKTNDANLIGSAIAALS